MPRSRPGRPPRIAWHCQLALRWLIRRAPSRLDRGSHPTLHPVPDSRIPDDLPVVVAQRRRAPGRSWLATLPRLLDGAMDRWDLELGQPFRNGSAAWVAPVVRRTDSTEAVLKITLPHREAMHEGEGLRVWNGKGAVGLLEEDVEHYILLIERCRPGSQLRDDSAPAEERLVLGAELLRRLWESPVPGDSPFETVDDVCREWSVLVRHRMDELRPDIDPGLVEMGAELLETLPATAQRRVLVHGDFNPTNILRAEREPWLAIDAKPMIGDPGYDLLPLATQVDEPPDGIPRPDQIRRHFEVVCDVLAQPVDRALAWSTARMVESALWHVSLDEPDDARRSMHWAQAFAHLAGL